ncbi:hypothetical protein DYB31_013983, partial [Aphanomyces astaci]
TLPPSGQWLEVALGGRHNLLRMTLLIVGRPSGHATLAAPCLSSSILFRR